MTFSTIITSQIARQWSFQQHKLKSISAITLFAISRTVFFLICVQNRVQLFQIHGRPLPKDFYHNQDSNPRHLEPWMRQVHHILCWFKTINCIFYWISSVQLTSLITKRSIGQWLGRKWTPYAWISQRYWIPDAYVLQTVDFQL